MSAALPPEAESIYRQVLPDVAALLAAAGPFAPRGVVILTPDRDATEVLRLLEGRELALVAGGHTVAFVPLEQLRAIADAQTLQLAAHLDAPDAGERTWCLLLGRGARASLRPLMPADERPPTRGRAAARGSA